jgi:hydroxymethylbilane synthase
MVNLGPVTTTDVASNPLRIGICAGVVCTKHAINYGNQLEGLVGRRIELVTVRIGRGGHLLPAVNPVPAMREALRNEKCDVVVHCFDEVPLPDAEDLAYVSPKRGVVKEALCTTTGQRLEELPPGTRVSVDTALKAADLKVFRPDLEVVMVERSLAYRLNQLSDPESGITAALTDYADLLTLGRTELVSQVLTPEELPPAAGVGAVAIEARQALLDQDPALALAFRRLDHLPTKLAVVAERATLAATAGETQYPVGVWGRVVGDELFLSASLVDHKNVGKWDAQGQLELPNLEEVGSDPVQVEALLEIAGALGKRVAAQLLVS